MRNPFARSPKDRDGLPVAPGAFPLVGHIPAAYRDFPGFLQGARAAIGSVFWVHAGLWVLVCTGQEALSVFKKPAFDSAHLQKISPLVAGQSLLSQDGEVHRHMRGAMNKPFLPRGLSASVVGKMMAGLLEALAERWVEKGEARILPEVQEAALDIIFRTMGIAADELSEWRKQYRNLLLANLNIDVNLPGFPAYRAAKARTWIDARLLEIISAARRAPDATTLLGALIEARDDDDKALTDEELKDNLRLLVLGGHETISATMAWIAIVLAARPELWDALCDEAKGATVPMTVEEAKKFPFAEALFRETVRSYPPFGMITRRVATDTDLLGKPVKAGTIVGVDLWGIAHDPEVFSDPDTFDPSRWLSAGRAPTAIEVSQFGAGPHFCLGYHLAWLEAVQFAVALPTVMTRAGRHPRIAGGKIPEPIYVPTERPPNGTKVQFVA